MPWFKVDDNLAFHHKVVAAGNPAIGLWARAGSLCAQQLTDGFVPEHMIITLGTKAQAERLVTVGLWDRVEGGYTFHGWEERQPSKAHVEAERAAAADRMREYRERKRKASQGVPPQVNGSRSPERTGNEQRSSGEVRNVFGNPDPTRPDPTHIKDGAAPPPAAKGGKRATQLPAAFQPTQAHIGLAAEKGIDLRAEWPQFVDHHTSRGSTMKDWDAALRTWIRNAQRFRRDSEPTRPRHIPDARDLEQPPDGLTPAEYAEWDRKQRERRRA